MNNDFNHSEHTPHDIESEQAKWAKEQAKRRKIVLKGLAVIIVIIAAVLAVTVKQQKQEQTVEQQQKEIRQQEKDTELDSIGFPEAPIKIEAYVSLPPRRELMSILRNAVDSKPADFHVDFIDCATVPAEKRKELFGEYYCGLLINGQHDLTFTDRFGNERHIDFSGIITDRFSANNLADALNDIHRHIFGESYYPPVLTGEQQAYEEALNRRVTREDFLKEAFATSDQGDPNVEPVSTMIRPKDEKPTESISIQLVPSNNTLD